MNKEVKANIIDILTKAYKAVEKEDIVTLKELSNMTIHSASIFQDEDSITVAVTIYSLSKIFERPKYKTYKDWPLFYRTCTTNLKKAHDALAKDQIKQYVAAMKAILAVIDKLESRLKIYIKEVIEKAKIKKGSRLHEHGISIGRTAELLGISEWELMDYVGRTGIADVKITVTKTAKERLAITRKLFK